MKEELEGLEQEREQIEISLARIGAEIQELEAYKIKADFIQENLKNFREVFVELQPHRQRDLLKAVVMDMVIDKERIALNLYGSPPKILPADLKSRGCCGMTNWLPGPDSNQRPSG